MMLPVVVLAILCVGLGVVAQWPMQTLILPAIADATVATPDLNVGVDGLAASTLGIWGPVPATVLILLGILGGLTLYVIGRASNVRVTNTFIGGEVLADETPLRVPAGGFYRTLEELDGVGGALRDGARGAYDVYRISGRCGGSFVDVLKRQHTGVLSLYVSWCLVGVVVIVAYLMSVI